MVQYATFQYFCIWVGPNRFYSGFSTELSFNFVCQKERCSGQSDGQGIIYMKNNDYEKRLFAGTVTIYLDLF